MPQVLTRQKYVKLGYLTTETPVGPVKRSGNKGSGRKFYGTRSNLDSPLKNEVDARSQTTVN